MDNFLCLGGGGIVIYVGINCVVDLLLNNGLDVIVGMVIDVFGDGILNFFSIVVLCDVVVV